MSSEFWAKSCSNKICPFLRVSENLCKKGWMLPCVCNGPFWFSWPNCSFLVHIMLQMYLCSDIYFEISFISWRCGIKVERVNQCLESIPFEIKSTMSNSHMCKNLCSGLSSNDLVSTCCSDIKCSRSQHLFIWCEASNFALCLCICILFLIDFCRVCCPGNPFVTQNGFTQAGSTSLRKWNRLSLISSPQTKRNIYFSRSVKLKLSLNSVLYV